MPRKKRTETIPVYRRMVGQRDEKIAQLQNDMNICVDEKDAMKNKQWFFYGVFLVVGITLGYILWGGTCFVSPI